MVKVRVIYVDQNGFNREAGNSDTIDVGGIEVSSLKLTTGASDGYVLVSDVNGNGSWKSLEELAASTVIGPAEDSDYTDGLFTDFTPTTKVGAAVDRFNELLKELVPNPPGYLSSISFLSPGVVGKLSFGQSNPISGYFNVSGIGGSTELDINDTFPVSGNRYGIKAPGDVSGTLADNQSASQQTPTPAFPANSFFPGDKGILKLEVNGNIVHSVDLSNFSSGNSTNINGSGFTLSEATPIKFPNGNNLTLFKYRTGTYIVKTADQRNGWNYIRVIHTVNGIDYTTQYIEFVNDAEDVNTQFNNSSITSLSMSGTKWLTGVKYHTSGTAEYNITISNAYRNTYSTSTSAISFQTVNCLTSNMNIPSTTSHTSDISITNKQLTITSTSGRILGDDISVSTTVDRTVQNDLTSSIQYGGYKLLFDNVPDISSDISETFDGEQYRIMSNVDITSSNISAYTWDSQVKLTDSTPGYADGLLVFNGKLIYPTRAQLSSVPNSRFDLVTNGPSNNPDYSSLTGERTYIRKFVVGTAQNFKLNFNTTNFTVVAASNKGSLTGNQVVVELSAPGEVTEWKDCYTPYTNDNDIGCFAATYGNIIPTNWGVTLGSKSSANSGGVILIKVTAPATWNGNVESITVTVVG